MVVTFDAARSAFGRSLPPQAESKANTATEANTTRAADFLVRTEWARLFIGYFLSRIQRPLTVTFPSWQSGISIIALPWGASLIVGIQKQYRHIPASFMNRDLTGIGQPVLANRFWPTGFGECQYATALYKIDILPILQLQRMGIGANLWLEENHFCVKVC
jgi:hypothetical protein